MTYAAIIPARYDSQRLPGKLLKLIGGMSVLQHTVTSAYQSRLFDEILVATDDQRIVDHCVKHKMRAVMTSKAHSSGTERIAEAAMHIESDIIINLQGDEPFIAQDMLSVLCRSFEDKDVAIATLCHLIEESEDLHDFNKVKVVCDANDYALYFSRQAIPAMKSLPYRQWFLHHQYYKHIGVYGFRKEVLQQIVRLSPGSLEQAESLEQLRWLHHGYRIHVAKVTGSTIGIDTHEDLIAARDWYRTRYK